MSRHVAAAAILTGVLLLSGCTAQSPQPMSPQRATDYYKRTVCPVVGPADAVDAAIGNGDMVGIRRSAASAASAYRAAERGLTHPPEPWPQAAEGHIPALAGEFGKRVTYYRAVEAAGSQAAAAAIAQPDMSAVSIPTDKALGLPPNFSCT